jgi:hypothetical protein
MAGLYRPVAIHPALQPYGHGLFIQEEFVDPVRAEHTYMVFPKPYPVVGFQYSGRLRVIRGDREEFLTVSGITGLQGVKGHPNFPSYGHRKFPTLVSSLLRLRPPARVRL